MLGGFHHRQCKTSVIEQIQTQTDQMDEWSHNAPSGPKAKGAITAPFFMGATVVLRLLLRAPRMNLMRPETGPQGDHSQQRLVT